MNCVRRAMAKSLRGSLSGRPGRPPGGPPGGVAGACGAGAGGSGANSASASERLFAETTPSVTVLSRPIGLPRSEARGARPPRERPRDEKEETSTHTKTRSTSVERGGDKHQTAIDTRGRAAETSTRSET